MAQILELVNKYFKEANISILNAEKKSASNELKGTRRLKANGWKKVCHANGN